MEGTAGLTKRLKDERCWRGFHQGDWCNSIDVRDFIVRNATLYTGDEKFLVGPSKRTAAIWAKLQPYFQRERKEGVLAVDAATPSALLAHKPGYITSTTKSSSGCRLISPSSGRYSRSADCGWSRPG